LNPLHERFPEWFEGAQVYRLGCSAVAVRFEDIQDLLGHKSQRITRHYSGPDIDRLLLAAETVSA
jgi:integrase